VELYTCIVGPSSLYTKLHVTWFIVSVLEWYFLDVKPLFYVVQDWKIPSCGSLLHNSIFSLTLSILSDGISLLFFCFFLVWFFNHFELLREWWWVTIILYFIVVHPFKLVVWRTLYKYTESTVNDRTHPILY